MTELESIQSVAHSAATAGGEILMRYFSDGVLMRQKSGSDKSYDLVSDADEQSEQAIAEVIRATFPDHELLGEESFSGGDASAEHLWVIDPLDGTNNFAHRVPHFAVSIGYYHRGVPKVAVVTNPPRDEVFAAISGGGATMNGRPLKIDPVLSLDRCLVGCGFYYDRGVMMQKTLAAIGDLFSHHIHGIRRWGTASLDLCSVACGYFGGFFEYQLSPWDFAAGRLIVEEAGGVMTSASGDPLLLKKTSVLAADPSLHQSMLQITARHHP